MEYKGYIAHVEYDESVKTFVGYVVNIRDVVTFESDTVSGLEHEFHESVEDYLEFCKELKRKPQRPLSGELTLKLDPALHRSLAIAAAASGHSLNDFVVEKLRNSGAAQTIKTKKKPARRRVAA